MRKSIGLVAPTDSRARRPLCERPQSTGTKGGSLQPLQSRSAAPARRPVAIDLFSGAGGLSLGFEQAGFDVVAAVEYDPVHALVHKYNFPECEIVCRDIRKLTGQDVIAAAQRSLARLGSELGDNSLEVDAIIGGPSCQGFSVMGLRDADDERNGLLAEFVRLVLAVKPRAFCLENVPGLLEPRFDDVRLGALKKLRSAGYAISGGDGWLNAADFGVPQNRKRVFILGVRDAPAPLMPEASSSSRVTVAEALEGLPTVERYDALLRSDEVSLNGADRRAREKIKAAYARELAGLLASDHHGHPRRWDDQRATCSRRTRHDADVTRRFELTQPGSVESGSHLFRLDPSGQAPTLRAGTGRERGAHTAPRPIHPTLPRVITVREAARLHGYPDWFRLGSTHWHGHRQVGNSVPPPLARACALRLAASLEIEPSKPTAGRDLGADRWCTTPPREAAELLNAVESELPPQRRRKVALNTPTDAP